MIIGIDIGATNIKFGFFNRKLEFHSEKTKQTNKKLKEQLKKNLKSKKFKAIGIGASGIIDIKKGVIINSPNTKIRNFKIKDFLKTEFKKPVYLVNDCVAAALGEKYFGNAKADNFIYITISTGIGSGIFVDGRLLLGKDGNAHEIGHIVIDMQERMKCGCGKKGHWEAYCSGTNIPRFVKHLSGKKIKNAEEFFEKPNNKILEKLAKINAMGIASLINSYDPELIIIGGKVAYKNPEFIQKTKKYVRNYTINRIPKIVITKLKDKSVIYGALALAQKKFNI